MAEPLRSEIGAEHSEWQWMPEYEINETVLRTDLPRILGHETDIETGEQVRAGESSRNIIRQDASLISSRAGSVAISSRLQGLWK